MKDLTIPRKFLTLKKFNMLRNILNVSGDGRIIIIKKKRIFKKQNRAGDAWT
jgi:hypothetical protein